MTLRRVALGEVMVEKQRSIDPKTRPRDSFALYSIPGFDAGAPEMLEGIAIGSTKKCLEPGDVVLSRIIPHIRRAWVIENHDVDHIVGSSEWIVFRRKDVHGPYLRHILTADPFHAQFMNTVAGVGGSLVRARPSAAAQIEIPLPPLDEQRRIAGILDAADALRRRRREALALLDTLPGAIFAEMFGDDMENYPNVELGENEQFLTSGSRGWAKFYSASGKPFIRIGNVANGQIDMNDLVLVDPPNSAEARRTLVAQGDVLISITADLGRIGVVPKALDQRAHINQHLALFRHSGNFTSEFLAAALMHERTQAQFARLNRNGVKAGLNFDDIRAIRVPLPPRRLQEAFCARLHACREQTSRTRGSARKLDSLFASLQSRAFAGEL